MSGYRLQKSGNVDRTAGLSFTWDGRRMQGYKGETLAAALMGNGERIIGRGFKYHRPRGVMSAGGEEGGALVTFGQGAAREPNAKATQLELYDGLAASGQNAWPNVRFDLGRVNDLFNRFFAAGFYYKTFFGITGKGTWEWMQFEKLIRRAAGMGTASREPDPANYEFSHAYCDLLVIGSGPAGLAAAEMAVAEGLDVIVAEQDFRLGGALLSANETIEGQSAAEWLAAREAALSGARVMNRTTAIGLYDGKVVGLYERVTDHLANPHPSLPRGRMHVVRPRAVLLATGALERPIAFGDNDRPGVMLADAMRTYVRRFGVAPGKRAVIATGGDSGYESAMALAEAGIQTTLLDARDIPPAELAEAAAAAGIEVIADSVPVEAQGRNGVKGLEIGRFAKDGHVRPETFLKCDCIGTSGGWSPAIHLLSHRGVRPVWSDDLVCFLPGAAPEGIALAGSAAGVFSTEGAIADGRVKVAALIGGLTGRAPDAPEAPAPGAWRNPSKPMWEVRVPGMKLKSFIDPQHDVTTDDVRLAAREGYASVEHMKRYTTLGMATDQGKMGGVVGLALLADALDQTIPQTGITTFRPPYTPIPIGALAGRSVGKDWKPVRRTPMHEAQEANGAKFLDVGLWKRAWYHPAHANETLGEAYVREATHVRERVGMVDVTTLGKIQVQGPDAAELLNRVYVNGFAKLPVMKCRYGVMLRDDGIVFDDGVTWRLAEDDFLMTCTTANAAPVMAWLENLLQTRWQDLRVHIASTSDQWAGVAVNGPLSRKALERVVVGDLSTEALPFMGIVHAEMKTDRGNFPVMIARISFSGELAFEVYAKSDHGTALWNTLLGAVRAEGGDAYGTEALGALRIEKGHVTAAELDGRVSLEDSGLGKMASSKKPFIGNVLRKRPDLAREDRPQLAHFVPVTAGEKFSIGAIVCDPDKVEGHGLGWLTGVTTAPALGGIWLGIGFVAGGYKAWEGKEVMIADPVRSYQTRAKVMSPHQYDPKGERMHG